MCDIACSHRRSLDGCIVVNRLTGNTAHNMNSELQAKTMYIISKRFKPKTAFCRGETVHRRNQPGICVCLQPDKGRYWSDTAPGSYH